MICNSNLKNIFGQKYYDIIINYIDLIQKVLNSYDVVIFMARKAYCFYKAIKSAGLLSNNHNCIITSSRVTTYNSNDFLNKKVAIIEDVVILGNSLSEVINRPSLEKINPDIYIVACSSSFPYEFNANHNTSITEPYITLNEHELLELATLITNYIIRLMIPYNVDYPIFHINFEDTYQYETFTNSLKQYSITNLSKDKNTNLHEAVIHFKSDIFSNKNYNITELEKSIIKLRLYWNDYSNNVIAVPILLLPQISFEKLHKIFDIIFKDELNYYVRSEDRNIEIKNIYKVIQYFFSKIFADNYFRKYKNIDVTKISCENEIFPIKLSELLNSMTYCKTVEYKESIGLIDIMELYYCLGISYDLIFYNCTFNGTSEFINEFISYSDIVNTLNKIKPLTNDIEITSSLILDIFIDNGIVVPRLIINDNTIERKYKFGEVAKLTVQDFEMFANVLYLYSAEKEYLDKLEVEKISVIFFRKFNKNFDIDTNEAEAYRICYSKFGPRISTSNCLYTVPQGSSLLDKLTESRIVQNAGKKYTYLHRIQIITVLVRSNIHILLWD